MDPIDAPIEFIFRIEEIEYGLRVAPEAFEAVGGGTCIAYACCMCLDIHRLLRHAIDGDPPPPPRRLSVQHVVDENYIYSSYLMPGQSEPEWGHFPEYPAIQILNRMSVRGIAYDDSYIQGQPIMDSNLYHSDRWMCRGNDAAMFDLVHRYLVAYSPVLASFEFGSEFVLDQGEHIYRGELEGTIGHMVVVTGLGCNDDEEQVIEYMNCVGPYWGYNGRGYVLASLIMSYYLLRDERFFND